MSIGSIAICMANADVYEESTKQPKSLKRLNRSTLKGAYIAVIITSNDTGHLILNVKLNEDKICPQPNMILIVGAIFFEPFKIQVWHFRIA